MDGKVNYNESKLKVLPQCSKIKVISHSYIVNVTMSEMGDYRI